jgi:hypothetical protein
LHKYVSRETDQLVALVRHKHEVLTHLVTVAVRQLELINSGDWTGLMKALSVKSRLLDDLRQTEGQLDPYRGESPDDRAWPTAPIRDECRRLASECGDLMNRVVSMEKESESLLVLRRDEAASRLQGMHTGAAAREAYAQNSLATDH